VPPGAARFHCEIATTVIPCAGSVVPLLASSQLMLRTIRIIGTATILASLFRLSQQISQAWGQETVGGYTVALAIVSMLFLVRAAITEFAGREVHVIQRDILWGLSLGAFVSMIARVVR